MKFSALIFATAVFGGTLVYGQTTTTASAPAGEPATTSAPATKPLAGPNEAAVKFLVAVRGGEISDILSTMAVEESDKEIISPALKLSVAAAKLQESMEKKFGAAEVERSKVPSVIASHAAIKDAEDATAKIDGDTATLMVRMTAGSPQEMAFKKVGGVWKLDAATTMKLGSAEQRKAMESASPQLAAATKAFDDTREEVEKSTWNTADGAIQALQKRLLEVTK